MEQIVNEGGINWCWFTEFVVNEDDNTVTIIRTYRLHKGEIWPERNVDAPSHPVYHSSGIWKELEDRTAVEYYVPDRGWMKIANPKYIFDYSVL